MKNTLISLVTLLCIACDNDVASNEKMLVEVERIVPQAVALETLSYAKVLENVTPAVVNIYSSSPNTDISTVPLPEHMIQTDPFLEDLFPKPEKSKQSLGSGVIVSEDGYVVTNSHVLGTHPENIRVVLADRREYSAKLILSDKSTDLAVIKITDSFSELPMLELTYHDDVQVGDIVLAVGNPYGVGQTVSSGIISATDRNQKGIGEYGSFIQTDAAINPGNSGGALINTAGQLVGINTAIYSKSGGNVGIGFAVPMPMVLSVYKAAHDGKRTVQRPWLGLRVRPLAMNESLDLKLERPHGVVVADVYPQSAGAVAGLRKGDVILRLNDTEIIDDGNFAFDLAVLPLNSSAYLDVLREGEMEKVEVDLLPPVKNAIDPVQVSTAIPLEGSELELLSPAKAFELGIDPWLKGAVISKIHHNSTVERLEFHEGDVIHKVNDLEIKSPDDLAKVVMTESDVWTFSVRRGSEILTLEIHGK